MARSSSCQQTPRGRGRACATVITFVLLLPACGAVPAGGEPGSTGVDCAPASFMDVEGRAPVDGPAELDDTLGAWKGMTSRVVIGTASRVRAPTETSTSALQLAALTIDIDRTLWSAEPGSDPPSGVVDLAFVASRASDETAQICTGDQVIAFVEDGSGETDPRAWVVLGVADGRVVPRGTVSSDLATGDIGDVARRIETAKVDDRLEDLRGLHVEEKMARLTPAPSR